MPHLNKSKDSGPTVNIEQEAEVYERPTMGRQLWALRNILMALLTPVVLVWLPICFDDPKIDCAYVILVMGVLWVTEAVPIAATSLIPIFLFPMIGLLNTRTVSAAYVNDTSMLFLGGLVVAVAIETWNLHRRMALGVLMLVGVEPKWLMAGLMFVTWFLSMWISNTATTAMMIPIVQAVLQQLKTTSHADEESRPVEGATYSGEAYEGYEMERVDGEKKNAVEKKHVDVNINNGAAPTSTSSSTQNSVSKDEDENYQRMCKALSLCICYSANIGGIASITGTGPNLVLNGQADILFRDHNSTSPITFASWLVYGLPLSFITLLVLWVWMQAFFLRFKGFCGCFCREDTSESASKVKSAVRAEYKKLGPISFAQWCVMINFGILVILWITRDLGGAGGWGNLFEHGNARFVSDSTPAVLISYFLFVCPSTLPNVFCLRKRDDYSEPKIKPILCWKDVHEKMPWSLYLILGAGFSLAKASQDSGLSAWLGEKLSAFSDLDLYLLLLILCYIVCFATQIVSNVALATLMLPIMAQLAVSLSVNPLFFMIPITVATSFAFMLPVATPPNAIVFSYGQVRVIDMVTCGFAMNLLSVPLIVFATATWGNAFFKLDLLPEEFATSLNNMTTPLPLNVTG